MQRRVAAITGASAASVRVARSLRRRLRAVAAGAVCTSLSACGFAPLPSGATDQSASLHAMWVAFLWAGCAVAAVVWGLIAWCVVRFRQRPGDTAFPEQFRRNDRMEIVYTVIPIAMVAGLFAITYPAERHVETIARTQDVTLDVTGFRWSWRFVYPGLGIDLVGSPKSPPVIELPLRETTRLDVTSADVDHSFWVPAFLFKRDAIPGLHNEFDWTPTRLGTFRGECGEFCGLLHADMAFSVRVVSRAQFAAWVAAHRNVAMTSARSSR